MAGLAVAVGVVAAIAANSAENDLAKTRLPGSETFDLTATTKPQAVDGTNQSIRLWNGAVGLGAGGLAATGLGAWLWSKATEKPEKPGKKR